MNPHRREHRAVVTGLGAVTPLALGAEQTWEAVRAGRSGIRALPDEYADHTVRIGGLVDDDQVDALVTHTERKRLSRSCLYGLLAAREAVSSAGLTPGEQWPVELDRFVILSATGYGPTEVLHDGTRTLDSRGHRAVSPYLSIFGATDAVSSYLSVEWGTRGANQGVSAACASGTVGLGEGLRLIRHGYADAVLVVGSENAVTPQDMASTANMRALASTFNDDPQRASRPFDRDRAGFVMAAGGAAILLESEDSARARGADASTVLSGYGVTSDAHHATAPHPDGAGARRAMTLALADAGLAPEAVDYVNAHGTSTEYNDRTELAALDHVLGEHARRVPISSTKSMTGHMIGAAGVVEALFCVQAMRDGVVPPTINLDDPEFPEFDLVPHRSRPAQLTAALSNSFGFGGHNASVILERAA